VLSDLQQRIVEYLTHLDEAETFALAGGAALIVRGIVNRPTRDLDFFSTEPANVGLLLPALEEALRNEALTVAREQVAPGFARLIITDRSTGEQTRVDLAADARLLPPEGTQYGQLLSARELAIDKVLAIFGRAEARDFVDLAALEPRYDLLDLCQLAREKDLGFQIDVFCEMLHRFNRLDRDEFDVDDETYRELEHSVARWAETLRNHR
jgi:hypothetical protein